MLIFTIVSLDIHKCIFSCINGSSYKSYNDIVAKIANMAQPILAISMTFMGVYEKWSKWKSPENKVLKKMDPMKS